VPDIDERVVRAFRPRRRDVQPERALEAGGGEPRVLPLDERRAVVRIDRGQGLLRPGVAGVDAVLGGGVGGDAAEGARVERDLERHDRARHGAAHVVRAGDRAGEGHRHDHVGARRRIGARERRVLEGQCERAICRDGNARQRGDGVAHHRVVGVGRPQGYAVERAGALRAVDLELQRQLEAELHDVHGDRPEAILGEVAGGQRFAAAGPARLAAGAAGHATTATRLATAAAGVTTRTTGRFAPDREAAIERGLGFVVTAARGAEQRRQAHGQEGDSIHLVPRAPSGVPEVGGPLLHEGLHALACVRGVEEIGKRLDLQGVAHGERRIEAPCDGELRRPNGGGPLRGDPGGHLVYSSEKIGQRDDVEDEADAEGLVGLDLTGRIDELRGPGRTDATGEALRAAEAGHEAEVDLGLPEARRVAGVDEIAGQGQFAAAAEAEAVDGRDHGNGQGLERTEHAVSEAGESSSRLRPVTGHLDDVRASHEGLRPCAGQDHRTNRRIRRECGDRLIELDEHRRVERVERGRAVDRQRGHAGVGGDENGGLAHGSALTSVDNIKENLKNMIFGTSVTIVIISPNLKNSKWVDWEIEYSLKEYKRGNTTSRTNGIVGVVMKVNGSYDWLISSYQNPDGCSTRSIDNSLLYDIIKKNRFNLNTADKYSCPTCKTFDQLNGSYISLVEQDRFLNNPQHFIENAYNKSKSIQNYNPSKQR
jgi:hypothetical protein